MTFAGVPRGKQQSERLGWGAGNVPKPINAFKPQKQTSVWESGWEQETPSSNPNQSPGLSGALNWELPRDVPKAPIPYWILSLASQASNILCSRQHFWKSWGGENSQSALPTLGSLSNSSTAAPANSTAWHRQLQGSWAALLSKIHSNFTKNMRFQ